MDPTSGGQPGIDEWHSIVKTSELTYFQSDLCHIFKGFRTRSGILATSERRTPPHASRELYGHLTNCRLSAWATA